MSKYYEAHGVVKEKIMAAWNDGRKERRKAHALAKQLGALECGYRDSYFSSALDAFAFAAPPDEKNWRKIKNSNWWTPRLSSKRGKEISKLMGDIKPFSAAIVAKIIGMNIFHGTYIRNPSIEQVGDRVFIGVPSDVKPKGCVRMSDIQYEAIIASGKKKK